MARCKIKLDHTGLHHCWLRSKKCCECRTILTGTQTELPYFQLLSRGRLILPSPTLANIFCKCFAVLDAADSVIQQHSKVPARYAAEYVLSEQLNKISVGCNDRYVERCKKFAIKIMVNVYTIINKKFHLTKSEKKS